MVILPETAVSDLHTHGPYSDPSIAALRRKASPKVRQIGDVQSCYGHMSVNLHSPRRLSEIIMV